LRLAQVKGELVSVRSLAVHSSLLDTKKDIIQKLMYVHVSAHQFQNP
jgi:hypothetical protein